MANKIYTDQEEILTSRSLSMQNNNNKSRSHSHPTSFDDSDYEDQQNNNGDNNPRIIAHHHQHHKHNSSTRTNNNKELTVTRGEILEILDDSRKWWKARNSRGQIAHVPHTIVGEIESNICFWYRRRCSAVVKVEVVAGLFIADLAVVVVVFDAVVERFVKAVRVGLAAAAVVVPLVVLLDAVGRFVKPVERLVAVDRDDNAVLVTGFLSAVLVIAAGLLPVVVFVLFEDLVAVVKRDDIAGRVVAVIFGAKVFVPATVLVFDVLPVVAVLIVAFDGTVLLTGTVTGATEEDKDLLTRLTSSSLLPLISITSDDDSDMSILESSISLTILLSNLPNKSPLGIDLSVIPLIISSLMFRKTGALISSVFCNEIFDTFSRISFIFSSWLVVFIDCSISSSLAVATAAA
ncbi:Epidermal growth factor receptor kinase substrate 8-like [Dermatophagoides farinae]|uniref:Epidermal growth factor receptor kinase substrate 8-like n=1 Tax=Dermatophagoides farinae TaxID=6954 RepID=A0A922HYB8_DERFA|nr:Epidermal growth factor receptor kinase substrate 8-like [Dermatophagoides farinae]